MINLAAVWQGLLRHNVRLIGHRPNQLYLHEAFHARTGLRRAMQLIASGIVADLTAQGLTVEHVATASVARAMLKGWPNST